jgi:GAF domain-containing protein
MSDLQKTKEQLIEELAEARAEVAEFELLGAEYERRAAELAVVNDIGQVITSTTELDDLIKTLHQRVGRLFDTTGFYMATYDEESDEWSLVFAKDHSQLHKRRKLGTGLSGYIIRNRQPLLFHSSDEMTAFQEAQGIEVVGARAHSWMGVPLMVADKVVGVMGIQSYERENLYSEQDLALFSTIAAQVAPALNNLRLLEETRRRAQQMQVINEVGQAITSVLDPDTVLQQIVDTTKAHFGYYFVCIVLVDGDRLIPRVGSIVGDSGVLLKLEHISIDLMSDSSLIAEAARVGQPALTNDALGDSRYLALEELSDTRSELCLPIKVEGRVIGVLDVQSAQPFAYDQSDVDILQALANQAGVAIENARLFAEARTRAEEQTVLYELGQALTTRLNVEEVVEEAYRGTTRLLDTTNFYVALYDPSTDSVSFPLSFEQGQRVQWRSREAGRGLTEHMIDSRQPLLIRENVGERLQEVGIERIGEVALSWLGVPLMVGERVLGVMAVQSYTTPRLYDEHALDLFSAVANQTAIALQNAQMVESLEQMVEERTTELRTSLEERERLQQEVIETQGQALRELSTPIIPIMDRIIVMPLIGSIDSVRARDITRALLLGIRQHRAKVVILDVTGVPVVDSGVADYLGKTIQAARLKGARTIITGVSDAVAETIVDLGIDWSKIETVADLQTGLRTALAKMGRRIVG